MKLRQLGQGMNSSAAANLSQFMAQRKPNPNGPFGIEAMQGFEPFLNSGVSAPLANNYQFLAPTNKVMIKSGLLTKSKRTKS